MVISTRPQVILFDHALQFGRAVVVSVSEARTALLSPEERALAESFGPPRRATFVAGRVALHAALERCGLDAGPIGATARGAPTVPAGALGSISHKNDVAIGLAARAVGSGRTIGVDVERLEPLRVDIARRILTEAELDALSAVEPELRDRVVRIAFSLKEAIYKALDPFVQRYVGFREVELVDPGSLAREDAGRLAVVQLLRVPTAEPLSIVAAYEVVAHADGPLVLSESSVEPR